MRNTELIIVLCFVVLLSYLFDLFSRRYRVPAVILLLASGIGLRQLTNLVDIQIPYVDRLLPVLGTIGLILIVLEGALELEISSDRFHLIKRAFLTAFVSIVVTTLAIGVFFSIWLEQPFPRSLLTAIPFAVISSAVAIPSVRNFSAISREFVTYESSMSDIMGIMAFNFAVYNVPGGWWSVFAFVEDTILICILSVVSCFVLLYLISIINHPVKYFPIITCLILFYNVGKLYHLSSLLLVLVFGLFMNNTELFIKGPLRRWFNNDLFESELEQIKNLTGETTFIVRTFFFLLFGYATDLNLLLETPALIGSSVLVALIFLIRFLLFKGLVGKELMSVVPIAPRGLITVLLFLSIPDSFWLPGFPSGTLMLTVILTALVMTWGLLSYREESELAHH
ncbi:cation:proton antiporter [Spirosoma pomorum]